MRGKPPEHHGMDSADTNACQHGKAGLGNHRHVYQYAITFFHAQLLQNSRHALHFLAEFAEGIDLLLVGFGGDEDQRGLIGAVLQVTINSVVAEVGLPSHKPIGEGRTVVLADLLRLDVPIHQLCLFAPEAVAVLDRAAIKIGIRTHASLSSGFRWNFPKL